MKGKIEKCFKLKMTGVGCLCGEVVVVVVVCVCVLGVRCRVLLFCHFQPMFFVFPTTAAVLSSFLLWKSLGGKVAMLSALLNLPFYCNSTERIG